MGQIIAALDLGTSKSIVLVARKEQSGKLSVIRTETIVSKNAIRRGRIYNSDETSEIISKLISRLNNNHAYMQVEKLYVGIGGQSLHTQSFNVKKPVENGIISQQLLDSMKNDALHYEPEFEDNLGICSCEYYADGNFTSTPKGTMASVVEARFQIVAGNPCLKRSLEKVLDKKEISVADYFISPLATAEAVLTSEEKESGCALVEFGEGVTYISVYKNKDLKYLITLPIGGLSISKDIRSLNVLEEEAEDLKINHGSAIADQNNNKSIPVNKEHSSSWEIKLCDLNRIIEARVDEIVKNIWNLIQTSGYSQELNAGIVITGGGALLNDLPLFIKNHTGKEVRIAYTKVFDNHKETLLSPTDSCVVGLATLGKDNCVKGKILKIKEQPPDLFKDEEIGIVIKDGEKNKKKNEKNDKGDKNNPESNPSVFKVGFKKIKEAFDGGRIIFDD